ncbi:MAG: energy-coupling factor transporter transmembrane component T [Nocardioidaceae bacterium]
MRRAKAVLVRANPLAVLTIGFAAVVESAFVDSVGVGAVAVAVDLALAILFVPGLVAMGVRLLPALFAGFSVGFSTWLLAGHVVALALTAGLRILVLAFPGVLLAPVIDPARLGDCLAQQLHLPARPVAAVTAAMARFERLGAVWTQLERARRARGMEPGRNPVRRTVHVGRLTFGLMVESLRVTARMAVAMDARGFASARRRTWAEAAAWRLPDTAVVGVAVALAVLPAVVRSL